MREKFNYTTELCLCGSGKLYVDCCQKKMELPVEKNAFKAYMYEFDKLHNKYKKVCLHPKTDECSTVKTHAHTISQKAVLELIAEDGKVLMPIVFGIENEFRMEPVGIEAKATKFYCFCSKHDGMFAPIDRKDVEHTKYNLFLYAYRIFASTYYKIERELACYYKLSEKYDMTKNPRALLLYKQMEYNMLSLNVVKAKFDNAILKEAYGVLDTIKIKLKYKIYFAAATCFCPMIDLFGNTLSINNLQLPLVYISVIPGENESNIIFSWLKSDAMSYCLLKKQLQIVPTRLVLKYVNNLLLLNCENMTISPKLWKAWTDEAKTEFINIGYQHLRDDGIKVLSKEYFMERKYNLFLRL